MDGPTDGPTDGLRDYATKKRLKSFRISRYWKRRNWTNWLSDYEKMCAFFSFSKLIGAANLNAMRIQLTRQQVTQGPNIVAHGWAGASNPHRFTLGS